MHALWTLTPAETIDDLAMSIVSFSIHNPAISKRVLFERKETDRMTKLVQLLAKYRPQMEHPEFTAVEGGVRTAALRSWMMYNHAQVPFLSFSSRTLILKPLDELFGHVSSNPVTVVKIHPTMKWGDQSHGHVAKWIAEKGPVQKIDPNHQEAGSHIIGFGGTDLGAPKKQLAEWAFQAMRWESNRYCETLSIAYLRHTTWRDVQPLECKWCASLRAPTEALNEAAIVWHNGGEDDQKLKRLQNF